MAKLYLQKINNQEINALTGEALETSRCACCGVEVEELLNAETINQ